MIKKKPRIILTSLLFLLCFQFSFSQSSNPFAQLIALSHDSGNGGFVQYELNGNPSEYNYYWTHGATELTLVGLPAGTYTLVVQDIYGCVQEFEVTILLVDACMLNYETSNGEPCTEVLILEVIFDGVPVPESELEINWEDGDPSGLTRVVNTFTGGTYCVSVSAPDLGPTCQSLQHCFEISAEVCPIDDCKLFFTVNTDRRDRCKKIINALVMKDGKLCEDKYEGYWEVECEPEVSIVMEENDNSYTMDLVHPDDYSSKTISLSVDNNETQVDMNGQFIVRDNFGNLLLDELSTNSAQILFGSKTLSNTPIVDGGFLDSLKVHVTNGSSFYIPLSPSNAVLTGVAGNVNSNDLIFNSNDISPMRTGLEIVTQNFLATKGYSNHENYQLLYVVSPSGVISLRFFAKHQPSGIWLGVKKDDCSLFYHSTATTSIGSNILDTYGMYNSFSKTFNTPCGEVKMLAVINHISDIINVTESDYDKYVLTNTSTNYYINNIFSGLTQTCPGKILRAIPKNCKGEAIYLWDTGATTETIPADDLTHTVDVDCECEGGNATYYGMKREVYADEGREYCVVVFGTNTGNKYEGCVFIPEEPDCKRDGSSLGYTVEDTDGSFFKQNSDQTDNGQQNNLSVSPNPFYDILNVKFDSYQAGKANLVIYSVTGQELLSKEIGCVKGKNIYSVESKRLLTSGVMLLQVTFPSGEKKTQRIIQINNN